MILRGRKIAAEIYDDLKKKIEALDTHPILWAVLVGENPASLRYISQKKRFAEQIWMNFEIFQFPASISEKDLLQEIQTLNWDTGISWFIVQLPLPPHINSLEIINSINPQKDVDWFHPENQGKVMIHDQSGFLPCTPAWVMKILQYYKIPLLGKKVVIIGRSNIVGKPLANLVINEWATLISCNSHTPDISLYTKDADVIISAVGKPELVTAKMVSPHAVIIDVGFSLVDEKIYGDTEYKALLKQGNSITPVPGGVGPMTVAMLLQNTYSAHIQQTWNTKI